MTPDIDPLLRALFAEPSPALREDNAAVAALLARLVHTDRRRTALLWGMGIAASLATAALVAVLLPAVREGLSVASLSLAPLPGWPLLPALGVAGLAGSAAYSLRRG